MLVVYISSAVLTVVFLIMRFFANGPSIPDRLLERRDEGNCVFICGAGVSLPSGLPTFVGLTEYVIDNLNILPEDPISRAFEPWREGSESPKTPLDQIFHDLCNEYGKQVVNRLVTYCLREGRTSGEPSKAHAIVERISCDLDGKPQIITTNFDRLFLDGKCREFSTHLPPRLPAIEHGDIITGVTYLHGCVPQDEGGLPDYVLSSADFGRAYLAEGWAASFIKEVIKQYTVVLLGYTAEDPPVKYLLQGLKEIGADRTLNLYAFEEGEPEEIEAKWRERGVTPIAYPKSDKQHSALWETLEAWANRADDPVVWRDEIISKASKGPRALVPHERGQVAHIVRNLSGAKAFAEKKPIITPEWLCVFDADCRSAPKYEDYLGKVEEFDPLKEYGLDDDPLNLTEKGTPQDQTFDNIFQRREADILPDERCHLTGFKALLPTRLIYLQSWIFQNLDSPIVAWWLCRHYVLHPSFMRRLDRKLSRGTALPSQAVSIWRIIEQAHDNILSPDPDFDGRFFDIKDRIKNEGWSQSVLLGLEKALSVRLSFDRPSGICSVKPPLVGWEDIHISQIADFNVAFCDFQGKEFDIPDDHLEDVLKIAEAQLLRAATLLGNLSETYFSVPSCYPDQDTDGDAVEYFDANDMYFLWFLGLVRHAIELSPDFISKRVLSWPQNEKYFFSKLLLFVYAQRELFTASNAASFLFGLDQRIFWDRHVRSEILFLIRDRWEDFSPMEQESLTDRILAGPVHEKDYGVDNLRHFAVQYAKWLETNGCGFSPAQSNTLAKFVSGIEGWSDERVKDFARSERGRAYLVKIDDSPKDLLALPVNQIIDYLKQSGNVGGPRFSEKQPFSGLIKQKPETALAALSVKLRQEQYEIPFWEDLLEIWPENACIRATCLCAARLLSFPDDQICKLLQQIIRWMGFNWRTMHLKSPRLAWEMYDQIATQLAHGVDATVEGEKTEKPRFNYSSGPAGRMADVLLDAMSSLSNEAYSSKVFLQRLESLLSLEETYATQVATSLALRIDWLHEKHPDWVLRVIVPWFDLEHRYAEVVWSALIQTNAINEPTLRKEMKPSLLKMFPVVNEWRWSDTLLRILVQRFANLVIFADEIEQQAMAHNVRRNLIRMDDQSRSTVVHFLSNVGSENVDGWQNFVIPFIRSYWPKNIKFKTEKTTGAWLYLLSNSGENFPDVLDAVKGYLGEVRTGSALHQFTRETHGEKSLVESFPGHVLEMVNCVKPQRTGRGLFGLPELIDALSDCGLEENQLRVLTKIKEQFAPH